MLIYTTYVIHPPENFSPDNIPRAIPHGTFPPGLYGIILF